LEVNNRIVGNEKMLLSSNVIPLLIYPLNEYKVFKKIDVLSINQLSHGLLKLQLSDGKSYTIKGDLEEIYEELNR